MKILHTSDWHIGKKLGHFSRIEEQKDILLEICQIAKKENVDAVLIAGDLYDTSNPSYEAMELLYDTLFELTDNETIPVIAIAGNHDSADGIDVPDIIAKTNGIFFIGEQNKFIKPISFRSGLEVTKSDYGFLEFKLPKQSTPLRVIITPYANEARLKTYLGVKNEQRALQELLKLKWEEIATEHCDENGVNILMTHMMFSNSQTPLEEPKDEKSILSVGGIQSLPVSVIPNQIQYVALGHLHKFSQLGHEMPVVYSGSLLEYSFSEANQEKYISIIEIEPNKEAKVKQVSLKGGKKLCRVTFNDLEKTLEWLSENQNTFVELTFVSDTYLDGEVTEKIFKAHKGIVALIPEILSFKKYQAQKIDLKKDINTLFNEYFIHEKQQEPTEDILKLFNEILNQEDK